MAILYQKGAQLCRTGAAYTGSFAKIVALSNSGSNPSSSYSILTEVIWEDREKILAYPHSSSLHPVVGSGTAAAPGSIIFAAGDSIEGPIKSFIVSKASATLGGNDVLAYKI